MRKTPAVLALCILVAGCWQSKGSLYGNAPTVQPLRTDKVSSTSPDNPKEVSHAVLTKDAGGAYRLTKTGAEVTGPDCDNAGAVARLPGVTVADYSTCNFTSRAALEAALKAQSTQGWKINLTYKYE